MEALQLIGENGNPNIIFDKMYHMFGITGAMHNIDDAFYKPAIDWLKEYLETPNLQTIVVVQLKGYNTDSLKHIKEILELFRKLKETGKTVEIHWYYSAPEVKQVGERLAAEFGVPFRFSVTYL